MEIIATMHSTISFFLGLDNCLKICFVIGSLERIFETRIDALASSGAVLVGDILPPPAGSPAKCDGGQADAGPQPFGDVTLAPLS